MTAPTRAGAVLARGQAPVAIASNARVRVLPSAFDVEIRVGGAWIPAYRTTSANGLRRFVAANLQSIETARSASAGRIAGPVDWAALDSLAVGGG